MLGNVALYAARKRKKPVQKIPKPPPAETIKSNPSKRHRDRLNGELDKLTGLLPFSEDIRARLDKLSVLRLSVGYLKVKSYFNATMRKGLGGAGWPGGRSLQFGGNGQSALVPKNASTATSTPPSATPIVTSIDGVSFSEGELLLQALTGFVLVVTAEGYVFYSSPTIQDYLGFHQSDVVHQSAFELIHTDDRALFRRQLHFALNPNPHPFDVAQDGESEQISEEIDSNLVTYDPQVIPPENSSFLERSFCCRFRCLLDNSSGFLALNFRGRLKYLHGQNKVSDDGTVGHPALALFVIATPLQPPSILEIRTKTLIFQTKHKLDFAPIGIDTRGRVVLGYSEMELCMRGSGYQFIHAADMMHCADNHARMIKTGDSGFTVFRLLTKSRTWIWVQANARLVFKGGKPDFIVARQRALTNEEGEEQLRLRRLQLPFNFATGEAVLYDMLPTLDVPDQGSAAKQRRTEDPSISPASVLGSLMLQDQSIYCPDNDSSLNTLNDMAFRDTHALVNVPGDAWQHPVPGSGDLVKAEATMQDMMETLQQIIGDGDLSAALNVDPLELKDWENTLLRMSTVSGEMSEDLDEILSNDILSYVEEQLLKEGELKFPDQLEGVPACLSTLDLQSSMSAGAQTFNWPMEPQNQLVPSGGRILAEKQISLQGTVKLTHMGPPQMASAGLNGPTLQQIASNNTIGHSVGLHSDLSSSNSLGNPVAFNPAPVDSCAQTQNRFRGLPAMNKQNGLGPCSIRQTSANHLHPSQMVEAIQNHLPPGLLDLPIGLQDQSAVRHVNHMAPCQKGQWIPSKPSSNPADNFVDTYSQNISNQQDMVLDPSPSSCLQGHFSLQTQNGENQRQSWQQQQQQLPTLVQNGHQHMGSCFNQVSQEFQRTSLPRVAIPTQDSQNCRSTFRPQKIPNMAFPIQGELESLPPVPSSSCLYGGGTPSVPVNGVHLSQTGQGNAPTASCQRLATPNNHVSPSKSSCFFQGISGGPMGGMPVIPQRDVDVAALSCQVALGLTPDNLLLPQQQYLNRNEQINGRPVAGNGGGFPFPSLPNGKTYYSESGQTNCRDF